MADPSPTTRSDQSPDKRERVRAVLVGIAVVFGLAFALLNTQSVTIHWIVTSTTSPLIVAMIVMALLGFVAGFATSQVRSRRRREQR
jgi:uncharacterized integral membrane protein